MGDYYKETDRYVAEILAELERAETKFPGFPTDPIHAAAVVAEESGELVQAALQFSYEDEGYQSMIREAIQTGAMALRFLINVKEMRRQRCVQTEIATRERRANG